jgi:HEAT repeat protein/Tfp pilus assembly protein PilF
VDLLQDTDVLVRQAAADALGHFGPAARAAVPALRRSLKDQDMVRSRAADALVRIQEGAADADTFLPALEDESLSVRVSAAAGLWNATRQPERVLPVLIEGLGSKDELVRGKAAETVEKIGPAAAAVVPALLNALEGSLEQPGMLGPISLTCLTAVKALAAIGPEARAAVPLLIRVLCEKNLLFSQPAGAALVAIAPGAPEVVQALVETLHAGDANVRMAAAGFLGQLGPLGERAVPALRETLADASALVRLSSAASLWKLGSREGVLALLTAALESKEEHVAAAAAGTLGTLGAEAVQAAPALRAALHSPDRVVRVCAAGALWKIEGNTEAVLPVLQAALSGDEQPERCQAVINLGQMGPAAAVVLPELLAALSSADRLMGRLAKNALTQISPAASLEADKPVVAPKKLEMTRLAGQLQRGGAPQDIGQQRRPPSQEVDDWSEAVERDRDDVQAYRCRARAYHDKGDFVAASEDWTHVIRLAPEDAQAYLQRGISELARKAYDGAIADFDEVLRRNPNSFDGYNQRAIAHKRRGDVDLAIADYAQALRIRPDSPQLHFNRSIAARAKKDYGAAIADLHEALRLKPDYPAAHNNLAWYLSTIPDEHVRDGTRAVEHARRACDLSGWGNPLFLCTFAAAHAEAGQFDEAIRWQKQALERVRKLEPGRLEEFQEHLRAFEEHRPVRKE